MKQIKKTKKPNKTQLAKQMEVSRSSLYYKSKMDIKDQIIKEQILSVLRDHPAYGHRRIALHLGSNKKRILRIMKKFGIKPLKIRRFKPIKKGDLGLVPLKHKNWLKLLCPIKPNVFWAADFTYLWFKGRFYYLATIIDIYTREIVGIAIGSHHNKELILQALNDALKRRAPPIYIHSDQGSEYQSEIYTNFAESLGCILSFAGKGKPWENGFQESFYSQFKLELGHLSAFDDLGQLIEAIYCQIHYYNHKRIHSRLKMSPAMYARKHSRD